MRMHAVTFSFLALLLLIGACTPAEEKKSEPSAPAAGAASQQVQGDLAQVMRGIMFPNANVIFAAQSTNPAEVKPATDPSLATDPLEGSYAGWPAVENSGIALAESANLLLIPGRMCSNGKPAPIQNPDWAGLVQGLRDAGMTAYKAGQSQNQDNVLMAADALTTACMNCHDKYREKPGGLADRCM